MNHGMRIRVGAVLAVVVLGLVVLVAFAQQERKAAVAPDVYQEWMANSLGDIYDFADWFSEQQFGWLPLIPPAEDFILRQPSGQVLPFDWKSFPPEFNKNIIPHYENSVPAYTMTVVEDAKTRETLFMNEKDEVVFALEPAGRDPQWFLKAEFPELFSGRYLPWYVDYMSRLYDSSRVRVELTLIPSEYVEPYLYVCDRLKQEAAAQALESASGGGMALMSYSGPPVMDLCFTAIERATNFICVTLAYPYNGTTYPTNCFTNRLDVFYSSDLLESWWELSVTTNVSPANNWIEWTDQSVTAPWTTPRFYAAGNADLDSDGDGYQNARELLMYHSDPTNAASHPVTVLGSLSYNGSETGTLYALATAISNGWSLGCSVSIAIPGGYTNTRVAVPRNYWFKSFRDVNNSHDMDAWEPNGLYSSSSTNVTSNLTGINITLKDVPSVWGSLSYTGSVNGNIWILAVNSSGSWTNTWSCMIPWMQEGMTGEIYYTSFPVNYAITGLPASNYWIRAFVDSNTNGAMAWPDLIGNYGTAAIAVSNRRTGINFALHDPPSVSGTVSYATYSGGQIGQIFVLAAASSNSCSTNLAQVLAQPGPYQLTKFPTGTCWIWTYRDSDNNKTCGLYEARGYYTNIAILVTGPVVNANIAITDPDTDGDGLGDWWEIKYFERVSAETNSGDFDIDHLINILEYITGTDPTEGFVDTDGDGMSDDWEECYGLNLFDPSDAGMDLDHDGFTNLEESNATPNSTDPTDPLSHPSGTFYVATNGYDVAGRGSYTNPFASIKYAVNTATNEQHVIIFPGIYTGAANRAVNFNGKNMLVSGLIGQHHTTIVDCKQEEYAFQMDSGETVVIRNLTIRNGYSENGASAISVDGGHLDLQSCVLVSNININSGGAIYHVGGTIAVSNCLFNGLGSIGNCASLYLCESSRLANCTIMAQLGEGESGTAIYIDNGSPTAEFVNCIIWGDITGGGNWQAEYCYIQSENDDPLFAADGWHLSSNSPCRNAGINLAGMASQTDLDGCPRIEEETVDIGVDEFSILTNRFMHMPSYDQSNTWGVTVACATTRIWVAATGIKASQWPLYYWCSYGDGQSSPTVTVLNTTAAGYIGTQHAYATTAIYRVSAKLLDSLNVTVTQTFYLACRTNNDFDAQVLHSIEDGLIWLYTNAISHPHGYYWRHEKADCVQYVASANGMALTAFAAIGHRATLTNDVYADLLAGGIRYLLADCLLAYTISTNQCNYNPDANTNTWGIKIAQDSYENYEIGSAMTAIIGVGQTTNRAPANAPTNIASRFYRDIVQDMADYCGWAQYDAGTNRGGWRYRANNSPDNSASFWPVLGLSRAAEWNISIPNALKDELTNWLAFSQSAGGGYGYTDANSPMSARTACGLAQLAFIGRPITNAAVKSALSYIATCTNRIEDVNNLYGMHAYAAACDMFTPPVEMVGTQSWRYICATGLLWRQYSDGSWTGHCHNADIGRVFGTAAAVAILAETAPWRVILQKYEQVPWTVYSSNTVQVQAVALPRTDISNLTFATWYRAGTNVSFTSIGMTNSANVYYTTNAIPAKPASTKVEYYLRSIYQYSGTITTQRYPSAHSGDFFSYTVQQP